MQRLLNWFFASNPELTEYYVSYIAWLNRPLKNAVAASLNGKHSMINIKFTHNTRKSDTIEICVERLTDGIYQSEFITKTQLIGMVGKTYHIKRTKYSLNRINLKEFLIHCNQQNEIQYQVGNADCHCFAKSIWDLCVINANVSKPNAYLVSVAKVANYKLDHKIKQTQQELTSVSELDPRQKGNDEILAILSGS